MMSIKHLCRRKTILKMSCGELTESLDSLSSIIDSDRFYNALSSAGKHEIRAKFFVVVGQNGILWQLANKYANSHMQSGDNNEIWALVHEGSLVAVERKNTYYPFRADNGLAYARSTFIGIFDKNIHKEIETEGGIL